MSKYSELSVQIQKNKMVHFKHFLVCVFTILVLSELQNDKDLGTDDNSSCLNGHKSQRELNL